MINWRLLIYICRYDPDCCDNCRWEIDLCVFKYSSCLFWYENIWKSQHLMRKKIWIAACRSVMCYGKPPLCSQSLDLQLYQCSYIINQLSFSPWFNVRILIYVTKLLPLSTIKWHKVYLAQIFRNVKKIGYKMLVEYGSYFNISVLCNKI